MISSNNLPTKNYFYIHIQKTNSLGEMTESILKNYTIFSLLFLISFSIPTAFAQTVDQDPGPPPLPEPEPEPDPINLPEPEPVPDPFPGESDAEKIQRLTEENKQLREQNSNLQGQVTELQKQNKDLKQEVNTLSVAIEKLREITMEQIRVILDLVAQIKETILVTTQDKMKNL